MHSAGDTDVPTEVCLALLHKGSKSERSIAAHHDHCMVTLMASTA